MERFDSEEIDAVSAIIRSQHLSMFFKSFYGGEQIQSFEREFARYVGTKYAISVTNGTISLELILRALKIREGDVVITTPLSFIATATTILSVGAVPVFVDIDPKSLCIDPNKIEEMLSSGEFAGKIKAILPVSLMGYPADMNIICGIGNDHEVCIIEDAAQALGAELLGKKIGGYGIAGSFSLQESKSVTSLGEGGMIVTDDSVLADKLYHIRNQGNVYGNITDEFVCTNARMTEAQAAFGRVQLSKVATFNTIQRRNAEYFLAHLPRELTPVYPYPVAEQVKPSYLLIPVYAPDTETRNRIVNGLAKEGVSQGFPGQNVGYYKQLICEPTIMKRNRISFSSGKKCKNAIYARDHIIIFDIHRFNHTLDDMKNYLSAISRLL
jgi:perosamine synthetase